jgi:hypothetical protein
MDNKSQIDISDLFYYFDSQERDGLDKGKLGLKMGQILSIREKLLSMPELEFNSTIKIMEKILSDNKKDDDNSKKKSGSLMRAEIQEIINRSANSITNVSTSQVNSV